jgi:thiol peroxidase
MRPLIVLVLVAACGSSSSTPAAPPRRTDLIKRGNDPLTIVGRQPEVGQPAPAATLRDAKLGELKLQDLRGKLVILSVVPSIDTRVCEAQTHHVSDAIPQYPPGAVVMTISRDLPFAQERFAEEAMTKTVMASDFKERDFGRAWGLEVAETGLLARSVWVIAADGKIAYRELVADQTQEPDYEALLAAVRAAGG